MSIYGYMSDQLASPLFLLPGGLLLLATFSSVHDRYKTYRQDCSQNLLAAD